MKNSKKDKKVEKKENKLIIIIILLITFILLIIYYGCFFKRLYFKDFNDEVNTLVFEKYKNDKEYACYGNIIKCKKINYQIKGKINTNKVGTYKLTYVINYKNKILKRLKKVNVIDKTKPEIKIEGNFEHVCPNGKIENVIITALDNYDGDITNKIKYKINGNKIIYKVKDSSNNETKKIFKSKIEDTIPPDIILNEGAETYLGMNVEYKEPGYVAIDNCDNDITKYVDIQGSVDSSKKGDYKLIYKVKDSSGNESTKERIVKVFERNNYKPEALGDKVIYLTFDDGPGPYTAKLLDILKKYDVKATFFVVGYNNNFNDLLKREYEEGHTVALHSNTHNYSYIYSDPNIFIDDLLQLQDKIKQYTNNESKIIRFPGGSSNTVSRRYRINVMSEIARKVEELGFRYFDWTISSGDAGTTTDTNMVISNIINNIKPGSANVVLQHDIKEFSVDAVESVIQYGLANGYVFAPITMDSPIIHQNINN